MKLALQKYINKTIRSIVNVDLKGSFMSMFKQCKSCNKGFEAINSCTMYCCSKCKFEDKVDKSGECWLWQGKPGSRGYGYIHHNNKKILVHRFSYQSHVGDIPDGLQVCHKCDIPLCVNPEHLFVGTAKENKDDSVRKQRNNRKLSIIEAAAILIDPRDIGTIAELYGVTKSTISGIKVRRYWRHIDAT